MLNAAILNLGKDGLDASLFCKEYAHGAAVCLAALAVAEAWLRASTASCDFEAPVIVAEGHTAGLVGANQSASANRLHQASMYFGAVTTRN